jgi:S-formylglutathione hydrolase
MGGHGVLICALKNPGLYRSVSAFAPIAHPMDCPWGRTCLGAYLGEDRSVWRAWDATALIEDGATPIELLIDQGTADEFLAEQLHPQALVEACRARGFALNLRMQSDYDHSYHFVGTFIGEHLAYHAERLRAVD